MDDREREELEQLVGERDPGMVRVKVDCDTAFDRLEHLIAQGPADLRDAWAAWKQAQAAAPALPEKEPHEA